ncbi:unnamed protein product [Caenorhabditis sp. 36 PRJEB53466]|nr:unnamed protein product [Caenorhabditis sp. 36 PRJEB53466]
MRNFLQFLVVFAVLAAIQVHGFLFPSFTSGYNYDCGYGYGGSNYGGYYGSGYGGYYPGGYGGYGYGK